MQYDKGMFDNLVKTFIQECNNNHKNKEINGSVSGNNINSPYTITKCEYYYKTIKILDYSVLTFTIQTNFITGLKMRNEETILLIHIAYISEHKFICIVLNNGVIRLFNYSLFQIEAEYKTHYGNIISVSFSDDGLLMGLGVEDDNVYIIDMVMKKVLFCLEGHRNYVSDIIFSLQMSQEEIASKNKSFLKQISYDTISKVKTIKDMHLFMNIATTEFVKCWEGENKDINDKFTNRNRADSIMNQKEIQYHQYDIYTCGLDGHICSWKIEVISHDYQLNNNENQIIEVKIDENKKKYNYQEKILLTPDESIKSSPIYIEKINKNPNLPIVKMIKWDTVIGTISKRNSQSSYLNLNFYFGTKEKTTTTPFNTLSVVNNNSNKQKNTNNQKDKVNNSEQNNTTLNKNTLDSKNNVSLNKDLKTKMDVLNQTSVKIKNAYSKTFNNQHFNTMTMSSINNSPSKTYNSTGNGKIE